MSKYGRVFLNYHPVPRSPTKFSSWRNLLPESAPIRLHLKWHDSHSFSYILNGSTRFLDF